MKSFISRFKSSPTPPPGKENANGRSASTSTTGSGSGSAKRPTSLRTPSDTPSLAPLRSPTPLLDTDPHLPGEAQAGASSSASRPHSVQAIPRGMYDSFDERARTVSASGEGGKKVTFRSPIPTPVTSIALNNMINADAGAAGGAGAGPSRRAASPVKQEQERPSAPSRSSTSQSYSSRRSHSTRKLESPMLSPTPSDGSLSNRSYLPPPASWSEMATDDLIANLGPRERTRQEVLYEIVSSEERYVNELLKLVETFAKALLPPSAQSPSLNLFDPSDTLARTLSPTLNSPSSATDSFDSHLPIAAKYSSSSSRQTGLSSTPASTMTPSSSSGTDTRSPTEARMNAYNILTNGRPSHKASQTTLNPAQAQAQGRSHHSLPPPPRGAQPNALPQATSFSATYARMSHQPGRLQKGDKRASTQSVTKHIELPEELEKVLAVLSGGILEGHIKLAAALKKRYDNQYPLVRSLADVFTAHSYILREYATYVLHLERALAIVDESLSLLPTGTTQHTTKRQSKRIDESPSLRLSFLLHSLEDVAAQRGESGLVISLSKPFQRLLKYPLLFQNLLFNTDPSLKEYEATLAMVDEVEFIVRTIEDEKSSSEEREKTRDVWARIEGLEKDKMLMAPKPNRLLVSETVLPAPELAYYNEQAGQRKSFKRLSDILSRSEHHDIWVVRFTDVSLLCEKTGATNLPIHRTKTQTSRSESLTDMTKRERHTSRRGQSMRSRNLYKFIKVHEWDLKLKSGSTDGLLDMKEISEVRQHRDTENARATDPGRLPGIPVSPDTTPCKNRANTPNRPRDGDGDGDGGLMLDKTPTKIPLKQVDGPSPYSQKSMRRDVDADTETLVSDRLSVMSFAFKGAEQIRPPVTANQRRVGANGLGKTSSSPHTQQQQQRHAQNAANAKFANRLRSPIEDDHPYHHNDGEKERDKDATIRPRSSKARQSLPPAMALKPSTNLPEQSLRNGTLLNPPRVVSSSSNRGVKGSTPAPAPAAGRNISAATAKRLSMKAAEHHNHSSPRDTGLLDPNESGVALWKAYGAANGSEGTPRRVVPNRHLGGRI